GISRCCLEPSVRDARRRTDSKAIPVARSVLDGDPSAFAGNPHANRAPILLQRGQRLAGIQSIGQPGSHLVLSKIAEPAEQVVDAVDRVGAATASERLELELDLLDRRRIQQL